MALTVRGIVRSEKASHRSIQWCQAFLSIFASFAIFAMLNVDVVPYYMEHIVEAPPNSNGGAYHLSTTGTVPLSRCLLTAPPSLAYPAITTCRQLGSTWDVEN